MGVESLFPLPVGWVCRTLGEVCIDGGGDVQTGPFGTELHASDYVAKGIPSIMPVNIGDNRVIHDSIARITEVDAIRLARYRVRPGDIVYSRRGDVERRALIRTTEDGWLCGTGCLRVRLGSESKVDPVFASYYLDHPNVRTWIVKRAVGATMPNLNTGILTALPFVVPPRDEQIAIAGLLHALAEKIDLNRRMNETLEALMAALFKSWFVDFDPQCTTTAHRFPDLIGSDGATILPTALKDGVPVGWQLSSLAAALALGGGEVQTGPFGSQLHASDYVEQGVPVVMPTNIRGRRIMRAGVACVASTDADRLSRHRLRVGDLVYSRRGDVEKHAIVGPEEQGWLCGTGCLRVRPATAVGKGVSSHYLSLWLDQPASRAWIAARAIGATMPNLNTTILGEAPVLLPTPEVLGAFDRVVAPLDSRVRHSRAESQTLAELRDLLLPKLLSGELRIRDAERAVEAVA